MKWSRYIDIIEDIQNTGFMYLFNAQNRTWISLDPKLGEYLDGLNLSPDELELKHPQFYRTLVDNNYIVKDEQQDIANCLQALDEKLSSKKHLNIIINPTLDCNLRCWYCYEEHLKGSCMQEEVTDNVITFLCEQACNPECETLQLFFFGGEPLLRYTKVVEPILKRLSPLCKLKNKKLWVSFTTNGVCLTEWMLSNLKSYTSNLSFQIAFDGGQHLHDKTKFFSNGKGCYAIVLKNAINAIKAGVRVVIRCNYTADNILSFLDLITDLKEYHSHANLYFSFHRIWQEEENESLERLKESLKTKLSDFKINSNINTYLGSSLSSCYGDYINNIVINYTGDVFKCTARDFSPENRLGVIGKDGDILYSSKGLDRISHSQISVCYSCRMLPICPICSQRKSEAEKGTCPINVDENVVRRNMRAAFFDLSRLNVN